MGKRKICVVTGTRAEYGLLYWLMKEIETDCELELQLVATGMHLSPEFGLTVQEIEKAGWRINERVEMLLSSDTAVGITKSVGLGLIGFADAFARLQPDIVVLLGDRFEILAAAQAAMLARIPIGHIHGGEATEGLIDEPIRHSVTKMAQLHFTSTETYRKRVIQLGEQPERVFNTGTPGLDNIEKLTLMTKEELEESVGLSFRSPTILVTYHPVTLEEKGSKEAIEDFLLALDRFPDASVLITKPNADTGGRVIIELLDKYAARSPSRVVAHTSLGQVRYLSALKHVDIVVGNSSSGLIEAPSFGKPTVNIGDRQRGRIKAESVIDCGDTEKEITEAIEKALSPEFRARASRVQNPYGGSGASARIKKILKSVDLTDIVKKRFYDMG